MDETEDSGLVNALSKAKGHVFVSDGFSFVSPRCLLADGEPL